MAPIEPKEPLGGLMRDASPAGDLLARQALGKLQDRLFGRRRAAIVIGRYELGDRIGAGGAGVVYRAHDPKHERDVALKLLHAGRGPGYEAARARLLREAQSLAKLSHPNVVRIHDVGTYDPGIFDPGPGGPPELDDVLPDEGVYIAMELLEGADLAQWLEQEEHDWTAIHGAFLAAGRGLAAAHALGLVHRDFKPANVAIGQGGEIRVLDFGLARATDDGAPDPSMKLTAGAKQRLDALAQPFSAPLTAPGTLLGTPAYMAPEQHDRRPATVRSDQYSFCLSLYEAWYGRLPFLAQDEAELSKLKREGRLIEPSADSPVPRHHFEALRRGLSPRPDDRFESMDALLEALSATTPPRRTDARRWWFGGSLALLGVGVGAWLLRAPTPCELDAFGPRWQGPARDALQRSTTAEDPVVASAAARSLEAVDVLASRGDAAVREACAAGEPERRSCVSGHRARFDGLVTTLSSGNEDAILRAARVLPRWPSPSDCDAQRSGPARRVAESLADTRWHDAEGRLEPARVTAAEAARLARDLGDPVPLADAASEHGHLLLELGRLDDAERSLAEALWSEADDGHHPAVVEATIDLLELARLRAPAPPDTPLWIQQARAKAGSTQVPLEGRLRLYLGLARLAQARGDVPSARADLDRALSISSGGSDHGWRARVRLARDELPPR